MANAKSLHKKTSVFLFVRFPRAPVPEHQTVLLSSCQIHSASLYLSSNLIYILISKDVPTQEGGIFQDKHGKHTSVENNNENVSYSLAFNGQG